MQKCLPHIFYSFAKCLNLKPHLFFALFRLKPIQAYFVTTDIPLKFYIYLHYMTVYTLVYIYKYKCAYMFAYKILCSHAYVAAHPWWPLSCAVQSPHCTPHDPVGSSNCRSRTVTHNNSNRPRVSHANSDCPAVAVKWSEHNTVDHHIVAITTATITTRMDTAQCINVQGKTGKT